MTHVEYLAQYSQYWKQTEKSSLHLYSHYDQNLKVEIPLLSRINKDT